MSVWGTFWSADQDDHTNECGQWVPLGKTGAHEWSYQLDHSRPCSCGQPGSPIVYRGSHILPADTDQRGGVLQLAEIPSYITRDGRDDGPDDAVTPWPYLRLSIGQEDTVLDERLVEALHGALGEWLTARTATQAGEP